MFHILGFLFFFVLIVLLIGFVILWRIVNTFLGMGKRMSGNSKSTQGQQRTAYQRTGYQQHGSSGNGTQSQSSASANSSEKQKVFDDDEGEYVEFEEIKD